ncbi:hypothetical protein, partial [Joostella sp.]|uniref:hypothetical protein n=1 Tax=Joostella sp. TaxID=2231138 RepID=UPI003A937EB8
IIKVNGADAATNSVLKDLEFSVADESITSEKISDGTIVTADLAVGTITSEKIADKTITEVDIADGAINPYKILADAVEAKHINNDVAGAGLIQNATSGALEVDVTAIEGDGDITSTDLTVTGGANSVFNDVSLEVKDGAITAVKLSSVGSTAGQVPVADGSGNVSYKTLSATEVPYENSTSGLTAENTQAAIDELAAGSTDDQTATEVDITTISGLTSSTVQGALEELNTNSTDDQTATEVPYENSTSGLTAENTQAAIDEVNTATQVVTEEVNTISKAARIFYPPSIAIDASVNGNFEIDLYQQYVEQFGSPVISSAGAPNAIPTYASDELYYYVTAYDTNVFTVTSIDVNGKMTYTVKNPPADYNSLINVVFVVK